jgi:hypothetical protein
MWLPVALAALALAASATGSDLQLTLEQSVSGSGFHRYHPRGLAPCQSMAPASQHAVVRQLHVRWVATPRSGVWPQVLVVLVHVPRDAYVDSDDLVRAWSNASQAVGGAHAHGRMVAWSHGRMVILLILLILLMALL